MREHLGLETLVLEAESDGRPDLTLKIRKRREVRDDGDATVFAHERRHGSASAIGWLGDRRTARVDEPTGRRQPVRDPELGVSDRVGERYPHGSRRRHLTQVRDDPRDGAALET